MYSYRLVCYSGNFTYPSVSIQSGAKFFERGKTEEFRGQVVIHPSSE